MKEQRVVSVATFHVTTATFEAAVLTNEQTTRLVVVSTWESSHNWAVAQGDHDIERTIADIFEKTASYELECFSLLARVEPKQASYDSQS